MEVLDSNIKSIDDVILLFLNDDFILEKEYISQVLKKITLFYSKNYRHSYHLISRFIDKKMIEGPDSVSFILNNLSFFLQHLKCEKDSEEYNKIVVETNKEVIGENSDDSLDLSGLIIKLEKLYDHIALVEESNTNNSRLNNESNRRIQNDVINTFNGLIERFQVKLDETTNSLNANIITVVGLFSAIVFVFFGGITSLANIMNGVSNLKTISEIKIPLLFVLVFGFILFNTVFLLLYSISKIIDKNIGSVICGTTAKWYSVEETNAGIYGVFFNDKQYGKCFKVYNEAQKYAEKRYKLSLFWLHITTFFKKLLFRFPHVVIINTILILGILYLYHHI